MPPVEIEELEDNYQSPEQHLEHLLQAHQGDAKKLLAFTFGYLNRNTAFFQDPEASKVLARLLRDVKGAPKASTPAPVAQKLSPTPPPTLVQFWTLPDQITAMQASAHAAHSLVNVRSWRSIIKLV